MVPDGIVLAVGDVSYTCPGCGAVIWEAGSAATPPDLKNEEKKESAT